MSIEAKGVRWINLPSPYLALLERRVGNGSATMGYKTCTSPLFSPQAIAIVNKSSTAYRGQDPFPREIS
jgi:hypothetical protein